MDKFLKKTECIIWQYGNFTAEEVNVKLNGINTQGENIADNGGIKEAYRAYSKLQLKKFIFFVIELKKVIICSQICSMMDRGGDGKGENYHNLFEARKLLLLF